MKNLKKVLALALAFAMSLTLFAGAAFTDEASIGIDYKDDVNMLVQLGVVGGYEDNSFKPQGTITRAETAKLIYVLNYGYDDAGELFAGAASAFSDVAANAKWANGYINFCYNQGIVGGVGNGKFNPNGKVTVAELAKMLLVSLGADATKEGYGGPNWAANVVADAMELGVFDGWSGDPTEPASRELACKLMRNTIFAPTYVYGAITGIGSQINPMSDSGQFNETLGEKKMGLKHVEGLVVSNARYVLPIDGEGLAIANRGSVLGNQKGRSQVYYEIDNASNSSMNGEMALLDIKTDLPDEMIGNVVDVYFKGEVSTNGTYSKVELLGDVLVNSKTVAYNVMSSDIEIMPNGDSRSAKEIKPYIAFTTEDGEEKRVEGRTDYFNGDENSSIHNSTLRVPGNTDYNGAIFAHRMFFSNATPVGGNVDGSFISVDTNRVDTDGDGKFETAIVAGAGANELALMGTRYSNGKLLAENPLAKYRFISVDGGKSFSYIIRLSEMIMSKVTAISDSSITLKSVGVRGIDDEAVVVGDVSKNMTVVAYAQDGKVYVEPTTVVTGKATNLKNSTATIAGGVYCTAHGIFDNNGSGAGVEIDAYLSDSTNSSLNNDNATYVTYKNYILEMDSTAIVAGATDYAVILYSDYDSDSGVVKVKVAFADNTVGTYEVSKIGGNDTENENLKNYFANNQQMGALVRTSVSNGRISLAANDKDIWQEKAGTGSEKIHNPAVTQRDPITNKETVVVDKNEARAFVENGIFYFGNGNGQPNTPNSRFQAFRDSGNSIVFMIYGGADMGGGNYGAINAKAYKLSNIGDAAGAPDAVWAKIGTEAAPATRFEPYYIGDAVGVTDGFNMLVAGVMSVGVTASAGNADSDNTAYILSAKYAYDTDAGKWYLNVKMITKDGLVETRSINEANNGSSAWIPQNGEAVGDPAIASGSLALFEMGAAEDGSEEEWIFSLETNNSDVATMCANGAALNGSSIADGYYAVQIGVADETQIGFFPCDHAQINVRRENWADNMLTAEINKYKFDVIAIDDVNFIEDGDIDTISYSDTIAIDADGVAGTADDYAYNAIIVVEDNEVVRVFSLYNNI